MSERDLLSISTLICAAIGLYLWNHEDNKFSEFSCVLFAYAITTVIYCMTNY